MKAVADLTRRYYKRGNFRYNVSSNFQRFTVPEGCTSINVECVASKGADGTGSGGNGGKVTCDLSVTQGQTLYIMVGAIPSAPATASYNASDIRTNNSGVTDTTSLNSRLIVAGGGGSASTYQRQSSSGGVGGGLTGGNGNALSSGGNGKGGTQTEGGAGGRDANAGSFGLGGSGNIGGAGGAGWYGGGAGSSISLYYGGGGGGSSYTNSACSNVVHTQGANNGSGYVNISNYYEGTATNYDYYIDTGTYKIVKTTEGGSDKYEAFKTLEKGQYYGN
jgi:hypothetical protein